MALKEAARDLAGRALALAGATNPRRRGAGHLSIATFHRVLPRELRDRYPIRGLCVTPDELDWFLGYFDANFTVGTLRDVGRRARAGETPSRPFLAVTFDDGQLDNFEHALPVLRRRGVRASFYLPVAHLDARSPIWHDRMGFAIRAAIDAGRAAEAAAVLQAPATVESVPDRIEESKSLGPDARAALVEALEALGSAPPAWAGLMSWDEVRSLHAEGHEIGSHSMTHPLLPECDDAQLRVELVESKRRIEAELGVPIHTFCYPNGNSDARVAAATRDAGYESAVTTTWGRNTPGSDPFALRRFDMHPDHALDRHGLLSASRLAWRMSGFHPGLRD